MIFNSVEHVTYRVTRAGDFTDGILQGNGVEWTVLQEAKSYHQYETERFKAAIAYSHMNDPYDSTNNHVIYEYRIPISSYGLNETIRFYVYVNDAFDNEFIEWPTNAGGKQFKFIVKDIVPAPIEWGNMHLKLDKESDLSKQVQLEEKVEVKVQAKQIKDLIIVRLRNMDDSKADIHAFKISLPDSLLKAFKGPKDWSKEGLDDNGAMFTSLTKHIRVGDKEYFLLKVDEAKPLIQWTVYGSDKSELAEGSVTPFLR